MSDSSELDLGAEISVPTSIRLPISSIVRALCEAANAGPDLLYEVMMKMSLMVEGMVPTYGLSIWVAAAGEKLNLRWAEGLEENEIAAAERIVAEAFANKRGLAAVDGDCASCLVLAMPTLTLEGAALYGKCVRPLTADQAKEVNALSDVAQLAHSHLLSGASGARVSSATTQISGASALPGMVFSSRAMSEVARSVERIKDSESTVLVTGESGTGKELIARAIHRLSRRSESQFIPFNCSAVPAELIESMLFGHRKGTFTGALADHLGLIRSAENGRPCRRLP